MLKRLIEENQKVNVSEGYKSDKLKALVAKSKMPDIGKKMFKEWPGQWDKLEDTAIAYAEIPAAETKDGNADVYPAYRALQSAGVNYNSLCFWFTNTAKKTPSRQTVQPGLLAVTNKGRIVAKENFPPAARGLGDIETLLTLADEVYAIEMENARGRTRPGFSASDMQYDRKRSREGATALKDPEEIKKANQQRYQYILSQSKVSPEVKELAMEIQRLSNELFSKVNISRFGEEGKPEVPGIQGRYGKPAYVEDVAYYFKNLWEDLGRLQNAAAEMARNAKSGRGEVATSYYEKAYNEKLRELANKIDTLKSGRLGR